MRVRKLFIALVAVWCYMAGCKPAAKKGPDIRKVKLDIRVDHFEKDFFALDTNHLAKGLRALKTKYGFFYEDFLYNIAAFSMEDSVMPRQIRRFLSAYRNIYVHVNEYIPHLDLELKEIESALKRAKLYFPEVAIPTHITTYIGPMDGYGSFAGKGGLGIGLQQFLGPAFKGYDTDYLMSLYGEQRLRQFSPAYIAPAVMESWINKAFPDKAGDLTLREKMIETGKKAFILKALLPDMADSIIFGYSGKQMTWCEHHNASIEAYFEKETLLKTKRPELILAYISDNQRPEKLPAEFPNNIGKYYGYLLVKAYMKNQNKMTLSELMKAKF